jgi:hypothetical protein
MNVPISPGQASPDRQAMSISSGSTATSPSTNSGSTCGAIVVMSAPYSSQMPWVQ